MLAADIEAKEYPQPVGRAALVMLASGAIEGATPLDLMLTASECGLTYSLIARTDIVGPVLLHQLEGQFLGSVSESDLAILQAAAREGASLLPLARVGLPVRSPRDLRLAEKRVDLERFLLVSAVARSDLASPPTAPTLLGDGWNLLASLASGEAIGSGEVEQAVGAAGVLGLGVDAQAVIEASQLAAVADQFRVLV